MNFRRYRRVQAGLLTSVVAVVVMGGVVATANAAPVPAQSSMSTLSFSPASGNDQTRMSVTTSGPCSAGTNLIVRVYGYGFPTQGQNVVGNTAVSTFVETANGGRVVPLEDTMRSFAAQQATPFLLKGKYTFGLRCIQPLQWDTPLDLFTGAINFTSAGAYSALPASAASVPKGANNVPVATTTPKSSSTTPAKSATPSSSPTAAVSSTPASSAAPTTSDAGSVPGASSGAQAAGAPVASTSLSGGGGSMAWPLLLALVAIALIAAGVFWYFRREPASANPSAHRTRK